MTRRFAALNPPKQATLFIISETMMAAAEGGLCLLAWKRRTGVAGMLVRGDKAWEERWIVVAGQQLLYYVLGEEDGKPRGVIDLLTEHAEIQVSGRPSADAPSKHEIDILAKPPPANSNKNNTPTSEGSPTSSKKKASVKKWKFCFHTQEDLMTFLETVHSIQDEAGQYASKDTTRFEHDFLAGDHIYRWEMIVCPPVIYPIQIHGIVLEAGRNCVVVADFGLTGYGKKEGSTFNHADDHTSNAILAAFNKLRPNQNSRLNILTLTDPMDIRKWTKANYGESFKMPDSVQKMEKVSKFLSSLRKSSMIRSKVKRETSQEGQEISEELVITPDLEVALSNDESERSAADRPSSAKESLKESEPEDNPGAAQESLKESELDENLKEASAEQGEDNSSSSPSKQSRKDPPIELPKSDPVAIVLARANYLLENEDLIPPYHVFFSNSECLSVWCKTGRWSTLQTAVFLSTNSVGAAKSSTLAVISVAAAHALLAPVVAVGGLIWVGAPMVILQKSRVRWQAYTELMTDLFWSWAPPAVFVSAIESWSGLCADKDNDGDDGIDAGEPNIVVQVEENGFESKESAPEAAPEVVRS